MFIPLEGEKILCLENVVALYRENGATVILKRNGGKEESSFTPRAIARRGAKLGARWAAQAELIKENMDRESMDRRSNS